MGVQENDQIPGHIRVSGKESKHVGFGIVQERIQE